MNKDKILLKLHSQFSYLVAEIPAEVRTDGETIELRKKINQIVTAAEHGDILEILPDVIQLEKSLSRLVNDFADAVKNSSIPENEATSKLDYYLGIKRAITALRGISDESLRPYGEEEEKKEMREDRKRWFDYAKRVEEK